MWIALGLLLLVAAGLAWRARPRRGPRPFAPTGRQYRRLLTRRNFLRMGGALAGAAALAYSGADEAFESWHTQSVKGEASDAVARPMNFLGKRFWFGYWGAFALLDGLVGSHALTRFGRACFEAMVVGLPTLWTTQRVLGASRPNEDRGPDFRPFADDNAASGHAFIWGIPCFVAWRMFERRGAKLSAAALAPWVGWSRINDRKHYLSQVLLGYAIAWAAVEAVLPGPAEGPATRVVEA